MLMKTCGQKLAFTLVEMLLVIAIVLILISMVVGVTKHIYDQGKVRLCKSTIELVGNALEQFRDFDYEYKHIDYREFDFPLDCNDFPVTRNVLVPTLEKALNLPGGIIITGGTHAPEFSGSEALYFFLNQVPDCRTTIHKIDKSLLTNLGSDKVEMMINVNGKISPLMRIEDPWKTPLRYDYYYDDTVLPLMPDPDTKKTFPVITSAGPDKIFDTGDDISNSKP